MEYKVIHKEFGGQPCAGYVMNIIDLCRNKDGFDTITFLKKIDNYVTAIQDEEKAEFFFAISTEEDCFAMETYVGYTVAELKHKDYVDGWEYEDVHYYRMYVEDEEWGLDEIQLCSETEVVVAEINIAKEPADIFNDKYKCPTCGYEFNKADRCPECGQLVKEKENEDMNRKAMEMVMFMTRMFYEYCHKDEIVDTKKMIEMKAEDRDDFIINFVEMAIKDNVEDWQKFLVDEIKESFPIEREGYLIEVEVSRIREVEEKGYINIIVPKTQADSKEDAKTIAEDYVSRYYDEESDIDWEINDEEFNIKDFVVTDSSFENEDTIDNLEARYNVDETLDE